MVREAVDDAPCVVPPAHGPRHPGRVGLGLPSEGGWGLRAMGRYR